MKAFEEWFDCRSCKIVVDCGDMKCRECKKIQAHVWEKALEWTLKIRNEEMLHNETDLKIEKELQE